MSFQGKEYTQSDEVKNLKKLQEQNSTYTESDNVKKYATDLAEQQNNKPEAWNGGTYWQQINDALNKILNREKFSYDLNGDMLYQQYKDKYLQAGNKAMQDAIGQASALTGGYGNSYAEAVGQQAYQGYVDKLNDVIPELYQLARDTYDREGQDMQNAYDLIANQYNTEYGQYRDTVSDWNVDRSYLTDMYNNERNFDYVLYSDDYNRAFDAYKQNVSEAQWNKSFEYQAQRDAVSDSQWQQTFDYGKQRDAVADSQWQQNYNLTKTANDQSATIANLKTQLSNKDTEATNLYTFMGEKDGKYQFKDSNGKVFNLDKGINPYTGTKNSDIKNGTFSNGYQPNNVNGEKLSKTGQTDVVGGKTQTVWKTPDGTKYIWDGSKNMYLLYKD